VLLGYIDLSKRRVSAEEVVKCEEKFAKAKAVSLMFLRYHLFFLPFLLEMAGYFECQITQKSNVADFLG